MKSFTLVFFVLTLFPFSTIFADGLLMPSDSTYPANFLRNKVTEVNVTINGLIAETVVYQEFVNEWDQPVDAVYSFPLPLDARSTLLLYSRHDTTFRAVLKVQQQSPTPGTGSGGIAALVNKYIGQNGLKLKLKGIEPGAIQKIELHYISLLSYYRGECSYKYPLDTQDFITYPIDNLEFNFDVQTTRNITQFNILSHPQYQVLVNEPTHIQLKFRKPKAFLASDLIFTFQIEDQSLDVDFYSLDNDTMDGHFTLFVRPENQADTSQIFLKNIVFLLGNSSKMVGYKLDQSIAAISQSLDMLKENDYFNIILYNSYVSKWENNLVEASPTNISDAKNFLNGVTGNFGSRLDLGLQSALQQFQSNQYSNSILAFTDGRSPLDPQQIASSNAYQTGIFNIGIGNDIDRAKLEMTSALNYGFVTYFDEDDNLREGMMRVFGKISQPILKNTQLNFNKSDVSHLVPQQYPTTFAGSYFFVAGRYGNPGATQISLFGDGVYGPAQYDYQIDFSSDKSGYKVPEYLWAKEMIDAIERQIAVYGETPALKDSVIAISLRYGIRCQYTAYVADYSTVYYINIEKSWDEFQNLPRSFILGNYPNPFNPTTTIRFYIDPLSIGKVKLIKIFNILGQLVAVIDISHLNAGWHNIIFDGRDFKGSMLPTGVYFVTLQIQNQIVSTIRINFVK